jgi:hypothetical protein
VVSGPESVTFADPAMLQTTATFGAPGEYVLRLAADDGELSGYDTITISVQEQPTFSVRAATDAGWVYQNTVETLARGGHRTRLAVTVSDYGPNSTASVTVTAVAGAGSGDVAILDDPQGDPLVKYLVGSTRTDGTVGCGELTLRVVVTGNVTGVQTQDVVIRVRPLGDADGNGVVSAADLLKIRQNAGQRASDPGFDSASDVNADGIVTGADILAARGFLSQ